MTEYYIGQYTVIHADLYRLTTPDELLYLDVRDWETRATHIFIEWAQNGGDLLPQADAICQFSGYGDCRILSLITTTR
jgi:hydrolase, P-loop family